MKRGISYQGFLPVRKDPSVGAEMISQLLFGESFTISYSEGPWLHIKRDPDGSEGWVHGKSIQVSTETEEGVMNPETNQMMVISPSVMIEDTLYSRPLYLPAGSIFKRSGVSTLQSDRFKKISEEGWIIPGAGTDPEETGGGLLSIPALHGGRCGFGFDAPGLVQMLCRTMGIFVPHSINGQAGPGTILNFIHEATKGDLAFFSDGEDEFTHVGMVLDHGRIIHSSDQVRIDKLDQQGIYNIEREDYTHHLRLIKRINAK